MELRLVVSVLLVFSLVTFTECSPYLDLWRMGNPRFKRLHNKYSRVALRANQRADPESNSHLWLMRGRRFVLRRPDVIKADGWTDAQSSVFNTARGLYKEE